MSESPPSPSPMRLRDHVRGYFLAGVLITGPLALTLYLAWLFIHGIDEAVGAIIPDRYNPNTYLPFSIPGLGVIVAGVGLTLIGALTAGYLGRVLVRLS